MNEYKRRNIKNDLNEFTDRRHRKKDWVVYAVSVTSAIGWIFVIFAFTFLNKAKPMQENLFTRILKFKVNSNWNHSILYLSLFWMIFALLFCILGFIFNMRRHRRKTDRFNRTIIILGIISLLFLSILLWKFWYVFF